MNMHPKIAGLRILVAISLLQYAAQTQSPMMKGLVERVTNESIFLKRLKFIQVPGLSYTYPRREALPGVAFRGLNQNYNTPPSVINPETESLSIMGGDVQTDAVLVEMEGGNGAMVRANEISGKVKNTGLNFDRYVLKGDPAVTSNSFLGLNSRITGSMLFTAGTNGASLTLAMLDQVLDAVVGGSKDKIIVCNKYIRRQITSLLRTAAHTITYEATSEQATTYDGVPIEVVDEDGDSIPILAENETVGISSVTTSLYVARLGDETDKTMLQGLTASGVIKHRDVGLLGTYYLDVIDFACGIGVFHPRCAARLCGLL